MEQSALISIGLPISLMIIMAGMGLSLTVAHFRHELSQPRGVIVGTLAQALVMPALAFAIASALQLPPMLAVGLVVLAACPGGTTSNLITYLAGANLALSIALTVTASVVTIVSLPIYVGLGLSSFAGGGTEVSLPLANTIGTLAVVVLLPVACGMLLRARKPALAATLERGVGIFGMVVLVALIVAIAASMWDRLPTLLRQAGPACLLLNLLGIAIGIGVARLSGLRFVDALTVGVELGLKNGTLGLLVALNLLKSTEAAIPSAVYGLLMYFSAIGLVVLGRRLFKR